MNLIFMGTPDFSVPALAALLAAGHRILAVYTQPARPAGRGQKPQPGPVQALALERGLPVHTPKTLRDPAAQAAFAALGADAAVVAAYGLILPAPVLAAPRLGCINIHASLLPRWRGAAPIQRAIEAGDRETGITIMQMDAGLDTGPMLLRGTVPIGGETNAGTLHDALGAQGAALIVEALARLAAGMLPPEPQPAEGVTYARKIDKAEAELDFREPAAVLERRIRAFNPWPGAWFAVRGERIKVLAAEAVPGPGAGAGANGSAGRGAAGTVLDDRLTVACGDGALRPLAVQRAGKAPMRAADLLRGFAVPAGTVLDGIARGGAS